MSWRELWRDLWYQAACGLLLVVAVVGPAVPVLWGVSEYKWARRGFPPVPGRKDSAAEVLALGRAIDAEVAAYHAALDALLTDDAGRRVAADPALLKRYRSLRGEDTRAKRYALGDIIHRAGALHLRGDSHSLPSANARGEVLTPEEELSRMRAKLLEIRSRYAPLRRELDDVLAGAAKAEPAGRFTLKETLGYGY